MPDTDQNPSRLIEEIRPWILELRRLAGVMIGKDDTEAAVLAVALTRASCLLEQASDGLEQNRSLVEERDAQYALNVKLIRGMNRALEEHGRVLNETMDTGIADMNGVLEAVRAEQGDSTEQPEKEVVTHEAGR